MSIKHLPTKHAAVVRRLLILGPLHFAQWFVTTGPSVKGAIPVDPFLLDKDFLKKPSRFGFVILVKDKDGNDQTCDYSFSLNGEKVLDEKLVWIKKSSEVILFKRTDGASSEFHKTITQDSMLHAILESTRDNQLFLTNAASQNVSKYKTDQVLRVFDWFAKLTLISPDDVSVKRTRLLSF